VGTIRDGAGDRSDAAASVPPGLCLRGLCFFSKKQFGPHESAVHADMGCELAFPYIVFGTFCVQVRRIWHFGSTCDYIFVLKNTR
jgi:hypothetical protein